MRSFKIFIFVSVLLLVTINSMALAYEARSIYTQDEDISRHLDLDALSSLFGESKDLADFEWKLNDPNNQISNLDLNNDNCVDYLRVVETIDGELRFVVIQAVMGVDSYQDIATIEIQRDNYRNTHIQIIGDPYLYGDDYVIEPLYSFTPLIYNYFWRATRYRPYYSQYRWGRYPMRYHPWRPQRIEDYRRDIHQHINRKNRYRYYSSRGGRNYSHMHERVRRGDYSRMHSKRLQRAKRNHSYNNLQYKSSYKNGKVRAGIS